MGVWLSFLDSQNGNPSRKGEKTIDLYCYIKVLKVKPVYQQMTLSPKLGVVEISTLWHFRLPLPIQMFIKVASSPRLSEIGMSSPILWSHSLKMQRIVLLSSLLWWELGTNSLITGPGEWLSFRRFTSKLSWSWSCCPPSKGRFYHCLSFYFITLVKLRPSEGKSIYLAYQSYWFSQCAPGKGMTGGFMTCIGPHNHLILTGLWSVVY